MASKTGGGVGTNQYQVKGRSVASESGSVRAGVLVADEPADGFDRSKAGFVLDHVVQRLNGSEWNSDSRQDVVSILEGYGFTPGVACVCPSCGDAEAYRSQGWCECGHGSYYTNPDGLPDRMSDPAGFAHEVLVRLNSVFDDTEWDADTNQQIGDLLIWCEVVDKFEEPSDGDEFEDEACSFCEQTMPCTPHPDSKVPVCDDCWDIHVLDR